MKLSDEIYYQTHEDTLMEEYRDYLDENGLSEEDFGFLEFVKEI